MPGSAHAARSKAAPTTDPDTDRARISAGTLLGGRVRYDQPATGFRSGIEPVLLAASVPARAGERVLEVGTGAGAGLLCLAHRVPGMTGVGVEIDPDLASLAATNASANGMEGLEFMAADITGARLEGPFDHAFANPPYHGWDGTPSPLATRRRAKIAGAGLLAAWVKAMAFVLRPRGTLTIVAQAGAVPELLAAFIATDCGSVVLMPLWPRQGKPAKLVLLRALRFGRAPLRLLPGLELHGTSGYAPLTDAILRDGAVLPL